MSLKGKTLFITGASRGIGLAIAKRAAADGANIVVAAKTTDPNPKLPGTIHSAAKEIEAAGGKALALTVDIREEEAVQAAVQAWLMRQARAHFTARLNHFAPLLGVRWSRLRLSSAQTRWGSAKADGSIALNWRLLHHAPAVIDYVVAHELAHLRVMDHSPRFWSTLATVVPDHAALRRRLRDESTLRWD